MRLRIVLGLLAAPLALAAVACGSLQSPAPTPNAVQATAADGTRIAVKDAKIDAMLHPTLPPGPIRTAAPIPPVPTSNDPTQCGPWSNEKDNDVAVEIAKQWGPVIRCMFLDSEWILSAMPTMIHPGTGVLAIYRCDPADRKCLDGRTPHPLSGWKFYVPPRPGYTRINRILTPTLVYMGINICFDLRADQYVTCPG